MVSHFLKSTTSTNPWQEDADDRSKSARAIILNVRAQCQKMQPEFPGIKHEMNTFIADLDFIAAEYEKHPELFRFNRALTAVHLPGILAALNSIQSMRWYNTDAPKTQKVELDLAACLSVTTQVRQKIIETHAHPAEVEVAVLKSSIKPEDAQPAPSDGQSGILGQIDDIARSSSKILSGSLNFGRKKVSDLGSSAYEKVSLSGEIATSYISDIFEDGIDIVTSPVARRFNAIGTALATASTGALVGGLVTAIVFPPAAPFAAGLSFLAGASTYSDALKETDEQANAARNDKKLKREANKEAKLNKLRGQSPIVRIETNHVMVTMNIETAQYQGLILTGKYAGQSMFDMNPPTLDHLAKTAPDIETADVINAWITRVEKEKSSGKPTTRAEKRPQADGENAIMIGLDAALLAIAP